MYVFNILAISLALGASSHAQTTPIDVREATIASLHSSLFSGLTSCRDIVSAFIARIQHFNPDINAVISLNPEALSIADKLDDALSQGNATGPLFCIPILLKDNYDALPMSTTGGCLALNSSKPTQDGPAVRAFRNAGAVILGKANLHELALEGLSVSSLGGQTINPYDFTRTPGGSSGGTGAAIAASFAVFGTGTDTVNSLRSPASANSLFSFRPTRGLISRSGVIPISYTQDTIGAIGRSLPDIATALTVMASTGYDPADNVTSAVPASVLGTDYTAFLSPGSSSDLSGVRIGVIEGFFNRASSNETTPVNDAMDHVLSVLRQQGAIIVPINDTTTYNATSISAQMDVQTSEYRELLSQYLSSDTLTGPHPRSMPQLYTPNQTHPDFVVIPSQYNYIETALRSSTSNSSYYQKQALITDLTRTLHATLLSNRLTCLIYPEQKNLVVPLGSPSQSGRNGILAALTGSPVITMPIGFSPPSRTAPIGIPIGMELLGAPWSEGTLLQVAKGIDDVLHARRMPVTGGLNESVEVTAAYARVPSVTPLGARNIPSAYPMGVY
ncbi:putative amidase family protein [Cladophialophora carrionii]|uniref:Putative amidase family protein n=1 Tax=Cladophialophora carrionii TaxID=86049 RepID=A0A1C1CSI2_9EURO|nr:putative amidase family protein [Cladophialophora carrionii]